MSQNLKLINKGDRYAPATYQFGRNERLNIHQNNYADLTDANTGACIRTFDWDFVRNMGYSPAKLLAGNEIDQFIDSPYKSALSTGKSYVKHIIGGALIGLAIAAIGNVTGCTDLVIDKAEQDISTSTIQPRAAATTQKEDLKLMMPDYYDDVEYEVSDKAKTAVHANSVIAKAYGRRS